jgi:hypothetical protein
MCLLRLRISLPSSVVKSYLVLITGQKTVRKILCLSSRKDGKALCATFSPPSKMLVSNYSSLLLCSRMEEDGMKV